VIAERSVSCRHVAPEHVLEPPAVLLLAGPGANLLSVRCRIGSVVAGVRLCVTGGAQPTSCSLETHHNSLSGVRQHDHPHRLPHPTRSSEDR